ncbi:hypothetical protein [Paenibacillus contaminans]|uniref:Uncharacterized protein n=1 Tax=Paenibacillus contaminans TaxID=450362 RepID=A0A329MRT7_9BACL|nr:hypothetical protein [Paenibacillus contaminans]RAV22645.1 hypothetical protein DQG23_00040 [Paenibacillus contaminans]
MSNTNKSVQVSVRVPKHMHDYYKNFKEKGFITESLSEILLSGLDKKIQEILDTRYIALDEMSVEEAKKMAEEKNKNTEG